MCAAKLINYVKAHFTTFWEIMLLAFSITLAHEKQILFLVFFSLIVYHKMLAVYTIAMSSFSRQETHSFIDKEINEAVMIG